MRRRETAQRDEDCEGGETGRARKKGKIIMEGRE